MIYFHRYTLSSQAAWQGGYFGLEINHFSFVVDVLSTIPQSLDHSFGELIRTLSHSGFSHSHEDSATIEFSELFP